MGTTNKTEKRPRRIGWVNDKGADLATDAVIFLCGLVAVVLNAVASGIRGVLQVSDEHELAAKSTDVWKMGDPLWWDIVNARLTCTGGPGCRYIGLAGKDKAATVTKSTVLLNERGNIPAGLLDRTWEAVADNKTLDAQDVGKVMVVTADAKTVTLPATAAGLEFIVYNGGADGAVAVTVSPNAADKIMGADLAGVDDKDRINTKTTAKRGDYLHLVADGSAGWYVRTERGIWAAEAA